MQSHYSQNNNRFLLYETIDICIVKNSQIMLQKWSVKEKSKIFNESCNDTNERVLDCISHSDWNAHEIQSSYRMKRFIEIKITKKKIIKKFIFVLFFLHVIIDFVEYREIVAKSQKNNQTFELSIMNSRNLSWSILNKRAKTRKWLSK